MLLSLTRHGFAAVLTVALATSTIAAGSGKRNSDEASAYNAEPYSPDDMVCSYDGTCADQSFEDEEAFDESDFDIFTGDDDCNDKDPDCSFWASLKPSECDENPDFMLTNCRLSCRVCDRHNRYSDIDPKMDGSDLGVSQSMKEDDEVPTEDIINRIAESQEYMKEQLELREIDPELLRTCRNTHESCTFWSLIGECETNKSYMYLECGPACFSCHMHKIENRCPMDRETIGPDVWGAGDLDKMFRRIATEEPYVSKYNVTVLSSPDEEGKGGPWVLTLDNFVSEEEALRLISLGAVEGYERSTDVGDMKPDGTTGHVVSKGRTSTNAWCSNECLEDELVQAVNDRISNMTGIPEGNSEDLQLLRYQIGQKYDTHHDYIEYEAERQGGVRLITVYLYLNDVLAGGGTNFPDLDLTVMPQRGRVLIWPSVIDTNPNEKDSRTDHQALPVEAGIKYGANAWFHMRNFKEANENGC